MIWPTSDAFKTALTQSHTLGYSCTLTTPGGATTSLELAPGSTVNATGGQIIRRTAPLQIKGGSAVFKQISAPGAVVSLQYGVVFGGGVSELVPVAKGKLTGAATVAGDGLIACTIADDGQQIASTPFLTAYAPSKTAGRIATVIAAVQGGVPGVSVSNGASDSATIGADLTWTSRADLIQALLTDAGAEGFFLPDGSFQIRDLPAVTDTPVWTFATGPGGTIENLSRNRPLDKLWNTVVVQPANLDASQTWTQVVAQITDTANPRHPNYIGTRPYVWQSPTIMSAAEAQSIAAKILTKLQGSTDSLSLGAVSNPALEPGDVIRATNPTDDGTEIIQHLIESLSLDIASGSMTLQTRSSAEAFA
jgi:Putative phage tail protein